MTWITQAAALCSLLLHAQAYVVPSKNLTSIISLKTSYIVSVSPDHEKSLKHFNIH